MRAQPDVVLATPGRVLDLVVVDKRMRQVTRYLIQLLNSPNIHLEMCEIVVLDECDRLLEMGFRDECLTVLGNPLLCFYDVHGDVLGGDRSHDLWVIAAALNHSTIGFVADYSKALQSVSPNHDVQRYHESRGDA